MGYRCGIIVFKAINACPTMKEGLAATECKQSATVPG